MAGRLLSVLLGLACLVSVSVAAADEESCLFQKRFELSQAELDLKGKQPAPVGVIPASPIVPIIKPSQKAAEEAMEWAKTLTRENILRAVMSESNEVTMLPSAWAKDADDIKKIMTIKVDVTNITVAEPGKDDEMALAVDNVYNQFITEMDKAAAAKAKALPVAVLAAAAKKTDAAVAALIQVKDEPDWPKDPKEKPSGDQIRHMINGLRASFAANSGMTELPAGWAYEAEDITKKMGETYKAQGEEMPEVKFKPMSSDPDMVAHQQMLAAEKQAQEQALKAQKTALFQLAVL